MLLLDLVKEEMAKKRLELTGRALSVMDIVSITPGDVEMMMKKTEEATQRALGRLRQDPALNELIKDQIKSIHAMLHAPMVPEEERLKAITRICIDTVEIWENAHARYNEQLKVKP